MCTSNEDAHSSFIPRMRNAEFQCMWDKAMYFFDAFRVELCKQIFWFYYVNVKTVFLGENHILFVRTVRHIIKNNNRCNEQS